MKLEIEITGERDRCAACGHVFYLDDELPEDADAGESKGAWAHRLLEAGA